MNNPRLDQLVKYLDQCDFPAKVIDMLYNAITVKKKPSDHNVDCCLTVMKPNIDPTKLAYIIASDTNIDDSLFDDMKVAEYIHYCSKYGLQYGSGEVYFIPCLIYAYIEHRYQKTNPCDVLYIWEACTEPGTDSININDYRVCVTCCKKFNDIYKKLLDVAKVASSEIY